MSHDAPQETTHESANPGQQLLVLWDLLDDLGAVVQRVDITQLPDDVLEALCAEAAHRVRALHEGIAAGAWPSPSRARHVDTGKASTPDTATSTTRPAPGGTDEPHSTTTSDQPGDNTAAPPAPTVVRFHQPRWRAIA